MKSGWKWIGIAVVVFLLAACSEQPKPEDTFVSYVDAWESGSYEKMYKLLSEQDKEGMPEEEFIEFYQSNYEEMAMDNLKVTYELPEEEQEYDKESTPSFDFSASMESVGGEIRFDQAANLIYEEGEDSDRWAIEWSPALLFPEMEKGDVVSTEQSDPERGEIFDANGKGLAVNAPVIEIGVVPGDIKNEQKLKESLSEVLGLSVEDIEAEINQSWVKDDFFVPIAKVTEDDQKRLNALSDKSFPAGVQKKPSEGRIYPLGAAAAHLTGYVGFITAEELEEREGQIYTTTSRIGKTGLEQVFEEQLRGVPGVNVLISKESEEPQNIVLAKKPVQDGEDVTLTIESTIQRTVFNQMKKESGAASAINPSTGEVKALVSTPSYDPNELSLGLGSDGTTRNKFNKTYSPGSTFKPITASIGLETGAITPGEELTINGREYRADAGYKVVRVPGAAVDNQVDVRDALVRSDNIFFARKAVQIGAETLLEESKQFGFGEELPFAYPFQSSQVAKEGTIESEALLAATGYGQGQVLMSPLHLAMTYTPFVTGGTLLKPTLLADEETSQAWHEQVISAETADFITKQLQAVVKDPEGTAHEPVEGLSLAGKTGTAQVQGDGEELQENGWFIGWDTSNKDLLVSMMFENTEGGSHDVVPKVKNVFKKLQ
ncbi:penicillin-binding transpeptidase domain-containing protein [Halobacillus salinus]|uniref:serine-type D-Ala-D-Ala carboxypeptidase n=1 Tax=Halobacillus salinus TaxID=192814 RepID=A0A4Z0GXB1_9BACI|nr:penicillin-binding transpeptidase domain-containing protein [Halobacillus salinus]TGB01204.1 penicillin-binding transpeptidase domain-containing protein [Halobacillus salinus]